MNEKLISFLKSELYKSGQFKNEEFPWDECIDKMKEKGMDCPECVCAAIKNRTVNYILENKLATTEEEAINLIINEFKVSKISNYLSKKMLNNMSEGVITIHGNIGSFENESGELVKGVDLLDVIAQVKKLTVKNLIIDINSNGGLVDVGYTIHDYLQSLKKEGYTITTRINGMCASIATIIALAGDKRQMIRGSSFLIHNPFLSNVTGDSEMMLEFAKALESTENELSAFYAKITKINKDTLLSLMRENKEITAEDALKLGFVTEIIDNVKINNALQNLKIFAIIKNNNKMETKTILEQSKSILAKISDMLIKHVKNLSVSTEDGKTLEIEGEEMKVGAMVSLDGKPTPGASYTLSDGVIVKTDAESKIAEVVTPSASKDAEIADLKKKNEELTNALSEMEKNMKETNEKIDLLSKLSSNYKSGERQQNFNRGKQDKESLFNKIKERREQLNKKNN